MEVLVLISGLARLGLLVGLVIFWPSSFVLLVREPAPWQYQFFRVLSWLAIVAVVLEALLRRPNWLHLIYGIFTALLLYWVAGLGPKGWLRNILEEPPEKVGPYYFWASFIGILLWLRFIATG